MIPSYDGIQVFTQYSHCNARPSIVHLCTRCPGIINWVVTLNTGVVCREPILPCPPTTYSFPSITPDLHQIKRNARLGEVSMNLSGL